MSDLNSENNEIFASDLLTTQSHAINALYAKYAENSEEAEHSKEADKLTNGRKISISGEATGSTTFDGSKDVDINLTITRKIFISSAKPSNYTGKDGDIWFQWI